LRDDSLALDKKSGGANLANTDKSLGTVIRGAYVKSGRSLNEFAKLLSITPSYQSNI